MDLSKVFISKVLSEVNNSPLEFSINYRRLDGSFGFKHRVKMVKVTENALGNRRLMNRSGLLRLINVDNGVRFTIYIDLLVSFNNKKIDFLG